MSPAMSHARPVARSVELHVLLQALAESCAKGLGAVLATVTGRHGSTPATPGQRLLLLSDGRCLGTLGGGALEHTVLDELCAQLAGARAGESSVCTRSYALTRALGMCCGGTVDVVIERFGASIAVGVVGAGHIAAALAPLLAGLGFAVHVADDREELASRGRFASATVHLGEFSLLRERLSPRSALLVMTHDHGLDQRAIEWALREGYAFVGGVGSRAKHRRCVARLEAKGFSRSDIERVRMPLGVAVGARSPEEIAVSIAAELIAWRRGHDVAADASGRAAPTSGTSAAPQAP